jgi:hypothetical protein
VPADDQHCVCHDRHRQQPVDLAVKSDGSKVYVDNKDRQRPVAPACFAPTPLVTIQAKDAPGLSAELASPLRMHRIGRMNTPNPASFVAPCP